MITDPGPKVLETDLHCGDPETQTLLPLLDDETDLARVTSACTHGPLDSAKLAVRNGCSLSVNIASAEHPGHFSAERAINENVHGVDGYPCLPYRNCLIRGRLLTSGGRIMTI